jgi:hypothetical protein
LRELEVASSENVSVATSSLRQGGANVLLPGSPALQIELLHE